LLVLWRRAGPVLHISVFFGVGLPEDESNDDMPIMSAYITTSKTSKPLIGLGKHHVTSLISASRSVRLSRKFLTCWTLMTRKVAGFAGTETTGGSG